MNVLLSKREGKPTSNYLIARVNTRGEAFEFVVCSNWNGKSWDWGHYFDNIADAYEYLLLD